MVPAVLSRCTPAGAFNMLGQTWAGSYKSQGNNRCPEVVPNTYATDNGWYAYCGVTRPGYYKAQDNNKCPRVNTGDISDISRRIQTLENLVDNKLSELKLKYGTPKLDSGGYKADDLPETMPFENFNSTCDYDHKMTVGPPIACRSGFAVVAYLPRLA